MAENIPHKSGANIFAAALIFFLISGLSYNLYSQVKSDSSYVPESSDSNYIQKSNGSGFFDEVSNYLKKGAPLFSLEYCINKSFTDYTSSSTVSGGWRGMGKYIMPISGGFYYGLGLYFGSGSLSGADLALQTDPRGYPGQFVTPIYYFGIGLEFSYKVNENIFPYMFLSMSNIFFQPEDIYGNPLPNNAKGSDIYSTRTFEPGIELGGRYFITDKIAVNTSLTYYFFPNDYLDDLKKGTSKDKYASINIGLTYAPTLGGTFYDSDNDGVEDKNDMCPETPKGVEVDEFGCPLDMDHDGVPDYLDKCENTPPGAKVGSDGCPIDSDHDGIPDYLDKCANTRPGLKVDSLGCPIDSDHDGVPDYLDKCPGTPQGTSVDSTGCPATQSTKEQKETKEVPAKEEPKATENVRIIPPSEISSIVLYMDTYFTPERDKLLPKAYTLLNILVNTMKAYPDSKWTISGYTDSTGTSQKNLEISKKAAKTVADYLISKGVNPAMLKVEGYGESNPVYSNDFPDGRALNRRVEIKYVTNK